MPTVLPLHRLLPLFATLALCACAAAPEPCAIPPGTDRVYVISNDWHSDIAIPVAELHDGLETLVPLFPGAKTLLFGYGKRSYITAPPGAFSKYFSGPFPGPAAIEVTALPTDPTEAYKPDEIVTLGLPSGGAQLLSAYIRNDITNGPDGAPLEVEHWDNPPIYVFAANSRYNFLHTCNGWAAEGLAVAGVPLSPSRVVTSDRLMIRAEEAAAVCPLTNPVIASDKRSNPD